MTNTTRLDKWLWTARFYRSRALAVTAIKGGHVRVNGERTKPSRPVRVGDALDITRGGYRWEITVEGVAERRGPASEARQLYVELPDSIRQREAQQNERRLTTPSPARRPDKRQRRKIIRFINRYEP
jgi:ribosome-associated heat shock protein Hsp15